jgi:hypothetical protein
VYEKRVRGATATTEDKKENVQVPYFHESSPYYRRFRATASDLDPILRTIMPIAPGMGERAYRATMDDVLVHFLGLEQVDHDFFVGYMSNRRVVVTRMAVDDFGLFCADETQVKAFFLALRSFNVQIEDITEM